MQKRLRFALPVAVAAALGLAGCQSTPRAGGSADAAQPQTDQAVQTSQADAAAPRVDFYIAQLEAGAALQEVKLPDGALYMQRMPVLTRSDLNAAQAMVDREGNNYVALRFSDAGARKLDAVSRQNPGKLMALVVNNRLVAAPRISDPLDSGVMAFQVPSNGDAMALAAEIRGEPAAAAGQAQPPATAK